jgi:drug/metabolite transporter (DMT)-like permease
MTWSKILYYVGIVAAVLTALAGGHFFSAQLAAVLALGAAALVAFGSAVTSGIQGASHKIAWVTVAVAVISAVLGFTSVIGPEVAKVLSIILTTIGAATAIGHPAPVNPATR